MGYTALLFCPDDKNARLVTRVLSELEFTVEASAEPFAAVKKLMSQHFDAVVVDCDNEQNATLLFKSARNSTPNQTSLAVAVVEGQAGVAKAFRIGANLVLTKPINIEQAKGTLRVARGLLRKAEPTKGAATAAAVVVPSAPTSANAVPKSPSEVRREESVELAKVFAPEPDEVPESRPTPTWTPPAAAASRASAQDDDLLDIDSEPASNPAVSSASSSSPILGADISARALDPEARLALSTGLQPSSGGAASAPAPAREPQPAVVEKISEKAASISFEKPSPAAVIEPAPFVGSSPSFSFGGADLEQKSGAGKKIFIGIAAAMVLAAGLYFGWTHFHSGAEQPANPEPAPISSESITPVRPARTTSAPISAPKPLNSQVTGSLQPLEQKPAKAIGENGNLGARNDDSKFSADEESSAVDKPEAQPLVVKSGKVASAKAKEAANEEAEAPSVIGMATPAASMPTIPTNTTPLLKPSLQTLHISQGVSQGLLIKKVAPNYPPNALRMGIEGKVELLATISDTGAITQVKVISGDSQLTKAAADAVRQWKYKPYLLNGTPVEIQTQITMNFRLPK